MPEVLYCEECGTKLNFIESECIDSYTTEYYYICPHCYLLLIRLFLDGQYFRSFYYY